MFVAVGIILLAFSRYNRTKEANVILEIPKNLKVNQEVTIPVKIDTGGKTINAAEVYLSFDPQTLRVNSVSKEGSFFSLWITGEPKFSNEKGEISFAGGLPNPGFSGKGQIGSVKIIPLKTGKLEIKFDKRTRALLNDSKGSAMSLATDTIVLKVGK